MNEDNLKAIVSLRRELHQHPELSLREVETKKRLIHFLKEHTKLQVVDQGSWFYALYHAESAKPTIAFRADYDAVAVEERSSVSYKSINPGVAHQCGHDGHAAVLAAFAWEIDQLGADRSVVFIFQHAEEIGAGAMVCAEVIEALKIKEIFAYHNVSGLPKHAIGIRNGVSHFASKGLIFTFTGATTHASTPELGRNPVFTIAEVIRSIPILLKEHPFAKPAFCTVVHVDVGERAFGVSPGRGELLMTIRAEKEEEMETLQELLVALAIKQAQKEQLTFEWQEHDVFPETYNHTESADKVRNAAARLGLNCIELPQASRGSEDFGYFTKKTKGAIFYVGNGEAHPTLHSQEYDFPDDIIPTAVDMFKQLLKG